MGPVSRFCGVGTTAPGQAEKMLRACRKQGSGRKDAHSMLGARYCLFEAVPAATALFAKTKAVNRAEAKRG